MTVKEHRNGMVTMVMSPAETEATYRGWRALQQSNDDFEDVAEQLRKEWDSMWSKCIQGGGAS